MRRTAAITVVVAVTLLGAQRVRTMPPRPSREPPGAPRTAISPRPPLGPTALTGPATPAPPPLGAAVTRVGERWVDAMWTRRPRDLPFAWLNRVADITAPSLAARLRAARPTLADAQVVSASVDIAGAYLDSVDASRVTVTCVAHLDTIAGRRDKPCATTVTVSPDSGGHLVVSAVA